MAVTCNTSSCTLRAVPHVQASLAERWQGVPIMAPVFHCAIGFALAAGLSITGPLEYGGHFSLWRFVAAILLFAPLAMTWDGVAAAMEMCGVHRIISAPLIIVVATLLPPLLFPGDTRDEVDDDASMARAMFGAKFERYRLSATAERYRRVAAQAGDEDQQLEFEASQRPVLSPTPDHETLLAEFVELERLTRQCGPDWLLFAIPLVNHAYFVGHALLRPGTPPDLAAVVVGLSTVSLAAHRRACLFGYVPSVPSGPPQREKTE